MLSNGKVHDGNFWGVNLYIILINLCIFLISGVLGATPLSLTQRSGVGIWFVCQRNHVLVLTDRNISKILISIFFSWKVVWLLECEFIGHDRLWGFMRKSSGLAPIWEKHTPAPPLFELRLTNCGWELTKHSFDVAQFPFQSHRSDRKKIPNMYCIYCLYYIHV